MVRSILKLNASISVKIGAGLRLMLAEDPKSGLENGAKHSKAKCTEIAMLAKVQKWGVPDDNGKNRVFGHNIELLKPESLAT